MVKTICEGCKREVTTKSIIKFKGKKICGWCKRSNGNIIHTGDIKKIPKHLIPKERKESVFKPSIKSLEPRRKISSLGLYLTKEEKGVLYGMYISRGLTPEESSERTNNVCKQMDIISGNLKTENKSAEELNRKFKEEFARLIEQ